MHLVSQYLYYGTFPRLQLSSQVQHLLLSDPHNVEYTEIYDNLSEVSPTAPAW